MSGRAMPDRPTRTIDGKGFMAIPGFVNVHSHPFSEPANKGLTEEYGSDKLGQSSLYEYLHGVRPQSRGRRARRRKVALSELLKSGVTTITDLSMARDGWVDDLAKTGIRAVRLPDDAPGRLVHQERPHGRLCLGREGRREGLRGVDEDHRRGAEASQRPHLGGMVGPAQIDTCREGFFKEALQEAKKRGLPMQTHACQAVVEFHEMVRRHGKTPIEWLDSIGVLGPDLVIGHGIFLNDHPQIHYPHGNDFELLRDSGAAVAHCPTVFARRGMVMNSIGRYMNAGITVGIGTDTFPHNMLDEIRLVCYLARVFTMNYKMGTTRHAFEAATIGGAKILRRPDLGRLAPGAKADFSLVDMSHPYMQPSHEPVRSLIYSASDRAIRHVYVDGTAGGEGRQGADGRRRGRHRRPDRRPAQAARDGQPARLGRPHRRPARAAGLRHEGPPAADAAGDVMGLHTRCASASRGHRIVRRICRLEGRKGLAAIGDCIQYRIATARQEIGHGEADISHHAGGGDPGLPDALVGRPRLPRQSGEPALRLRAAARDPFRPAVALGPDQSLVGQCSSPCRRCRSPGRCAAARAGGPGHPAAAGALRSGPLVEPVEDRRRIDQRRAIRQNQRGNAAQRVGRSLRESKSANTERVSCSKSKPSICRLTATRRV